MKLYNLKSDNDREEVGDVLINLEKILTIRAAQLKNYFLICVDYTHEDSVKQKYETRESCVAALKDLFAAMGGNPEIIDDFVITVRKEESEKMKKITAAYEALKSLSS